MKTVQSWLLCAWRENFAKRFCVSDGGPGDPAMMQFPGRSGGSCRVKELPK